MFSALLSFLGGSVFRMIWGELSAWLNKRQDHQHEIERLRLQADLDERAHQRRMESVRFEAEQQVKVIRVQADAAVGQLEAEGWLEAVKATGRSVGVAWVDAWNAVIRPGVATWGVAMLTLAEIGAITALSEGTQSVIFAALGIYLADRTLGKRGK
jgi:hypothetical protein